MLTRIRNSWRWNAYRLKRLKQLVWQLEQLPNAIQQQVELSSTPLQHQLEQITETTRRQMEALPGILGQQIAATLSANSDLIKSGSVVLQQEAEQRSERVIAKLQAETAALRRMLILNSQSLVCLAEATAQTAQPALPVPAAAPLVSVVMPTWNRAGLIHRALASLLRQTYANWECLIVDDGSTDDTEQTISTYLKDPRFRYFYQSHQNAAVARNRALIVARGQIIAYLDTDNAWLPHYLATIVAAFNNDPSLDMAYAAQIVAHGQEQVSFIRCEPFTYDRLQQANFIDLNVFAHRAALFAELGGFDERLESLQDWDLLLRYTRDRKVERLAALGGVYSFGAPNQITQRMPHAHSAYLIRQKAVVPTRRCLKVLYAVWHYPQLSESYIRWEIVAARKLGVEVEVWSEEEVAASFVSEVPIHRGRLEDAITKFQPDVVHTHWLNIAVQLAETVARAGLPLTARGHGFEFSPESIAWLDAQSAVKAVYVFPHFMARLNGASAKIKALPALFNPDLYPPHKQKDRRLVLRTGCALPSKDYASFMKTAQLCPDHRFVLNLCQAYQVESYLDKMRELNRSLGNPVEIIANLQHEEVAVLMRQAGVYLHTVHTNGPAATTFGMPISISEAMATGSYIIGRRCPGSAEYIGAAGAFYDTPEEAAALIRATTQWNDEQWHLAFARSVDRAYREFVDVAAVQQIIADWETFARPARHTQSTTSLNSNPKEIIQ